MRTMLSAFRAVALPLLLTRLLLVGITVTAPWWRWVVPDPGPGNVRLGPSIVDTFVARWYHWDAVWYVRIAGNGPQMGYSRYTETLAHRYSAFAFFPLYPLIIRVMATGETGALAPVSPGRGPQLGLVVAALVVSNLAFMLALAALYVHVHARDGPAAGRRAAWLLCLFPTTVFFSAPYSESLFLLWLVLFFLAIDRRRWWFAAVCGALAAATRSLGVALVIPYLVAFWQDVARHPSPRPKLPLLLGALIPLGLLGYMIYLGLAWGNPLRFHIAEESWGRVLAVPWVGVVDGLMWSLGQRPQLYWQGFFDVLYAVVFLGLTAIAWRGIDRPGRAYAVVFWLYVLCEPQVTFRDHPDTLISMARFLLVLLPLWIWLARSRARTLVVILPSTILFLIYAARWISGAWIG